MSFGSIDTIARVSGLVSSYVLPLFSTLVNLATYVVILAKTMGYGGIRNLFLKKCFKNRGKFRKGYYNKGRLERLGRYGPGSEQPIQSYP